MAKYKNTKHNLGGNGLTKVVWSWMAKYKNPKHNLGGKGSTKVLRSWKG